MSSGFVKYSLDKFWTFAAREYKKVSQPIKLDYSNKPTVIVIKIVVAVRVGVVIKIIDTPQPPNSSYFTSWKEFRNSIKTKQ
ncbi:MAG: hypothetical protein ABIF40_03295 [archaeon]